MKAFADARWRDLIALIIVVGVILVVASIIRDEGLPSSLAFVSLALAGALVAGVVALAKRREHR